MAKLPALSTGNAGLNSGVETIAEIMRINDIKLHPAFEKLFKINPHVKDEIIDRMKKYGYDKAEPVVIWKEEGVLIDGHTRREACIECGFTTIPVDKRSFVSIEDALEYAYGKQLSRRNLTDAEMFVASTTFDQLKNRGRLSYSEEDPEFKKGKSALYTAKVLGTSTTKVERIRAIQKRANETIKQAVAHGELTINQAYQQVRQKKDGEEKLKPQVFTSEADILPNKQRCAPSKTLYEQIGKYSVSEMAAFLHHIQSIPIKTEIEWKDNLNQFYAVEF